jgi:hypothetical protein
VDAESLYKNCDVFHMECESWGGFQYLKNVDQAR